MSASMEVLGIGGHEKFAEEIFSKVKEGTIKIVEVTKAQYDALTPEQKADPTKLYLVPGSGGYLKFVEISDEDYEALTEEQKMDPTTVYLTPGEGTYFRVVDISQEDYDALPPEEKADPQVLYLIPGEDPSGDYNKVVVNLTWDSTNGCYVSDKPLIALPEMDKNAIQNLMIDEGYDVEFRIIETTEPSTGMVVDNQRTMHLYLSHRVSSNMTTSYMQFYIPRNKTGGGIEFIKYKAQYDSTYDSSSRCTHIFPDNT